jgi:hypothetical protein
VFGGNGKLRCLSFVNLFFLLLALEVIDPQSVRGAWLLVQISRQEISHILPNSMLRSKIKAALPTKFSKSTPLFSDFPFLNFDRHTMMLQRKSVPVVHLVLPWRRFRSPAPLLKLTYDAEHGSCSGSGNEWHHTCLRKELRCIKDIPRSVLAPRLQNLQKSPVLCHRNGFYSLFFLNRTSKVCSLRYRATRYELALSSRTVYADAERCTIYIFACSNVGPKEGPK